MTKNPEVYQKPEEDLTDQLLSKVALEAAILAPIGLESIYARAAIEDKKFDLETATHVAARVNDTLLASDS